MAELMHFGEELYMSSSNWIRLVVGDTFDIIKELPSESFDLVILDPPYLVTEPPEVLGTHHGAMDGTIIDWGIFFKELYRVMREDASIAVFGHISFLIKVAPLLENAKFKYLIDLVWVKPNAVNYLKAKMKPLSRHETIFLFYKGRFRYNWQDSLESGKAYKRIKHMKKKSSFYDVTSSDSLNDGYRFMSDVIFAPNKPNMNISERTEHPTQKPLELIRKLVTAFSFPNDTVFDPFAGSGTTLVTCKELNRNCLGIEINKEYADIIRMRMRKEAKQNQLTQFLG